jgi:hypothetical protein
LTTSEDDRITLEDFAEIAMDIGAAKQRIDDIREERDQLRARIDEASALTRDALSWFDSAEEQAGQTVLQVDRTRFEHILRVLGVTP